MLMCPCPVAQHTYSQEAAVLCGSKVAALAVAGCAVAAAARDLPAADALASRVAVHCHVAVRSLGGNKVTCTSQGLWVCVCVHVQETMKGEEGVVALVVTSPTTPLSCCC